MGVIRWCDGCGWLNGPVAVGYEYLDAPIFDDASDDSESG